MRLAVVAHHHAILLVAEGGGAEPERAGLFVEMAAGAQTLDRLVDGAALGQRAFGIPFLIVDAEAGQVVADVVEDGVQSQLEDIAVAVVAQQALGGGDQPVDMCFLVAALVLVPVRRRGVGGHATEDLFAVHAIGIAMLAVQGRGDIPDIVAPVAVARKAQALAAEFQVTQPDRGAEDVHLTPGVVDVILAVDLETDRLQQIRDHRAVRGPATMPDMQRAGGIGRDEFDLHAPAGTDPA